MIKPKVKVLSTSDTTFEPVSIAVPLLHKSVLQQLMYIEPAGEFTEESLHEERQS